jgi:catechol 2,3-dioxygenase-like lactoylglutathione lyase family enzyme
MNMSVINAVDVAHVRFVVADLAKQRAFLKQFGLIEVGEHGGTVYLRATGTAPFCYAVSEGETRFAGLGIWARNLADLEALAAHDGVPVEPLDAPGGGYAVRLSDPDGLTVEVVAGQQMAAPLPLPQPLIWNEGRGHTRIGQFRRTVAGPSTVLRLGHVLLSVSHFPTTEAWYKQRFGLLTSDEISPAPDVAIGAFMRANRGETPSDHHTVACIQTGGPAGLLHSAFEVSGLDDLMAGHDHLKSAGYEPSWGIGRHILGSQVFDYWRDPHGFEIEHWTDGDQLRASDGGGRAGMDAALGVQWGMQMPAPPPMA